MKIKFTDLLNNYQDSTIDFKYKNVVDSKKILQRAGVTRRSHITMTKRSLSILLASAVIMMSGVTVYAVESGTLDKFIANALKYRTTPYSYNGTYNEVIDYDTFFTENINTNIKAENVICTNPDVNIEIEGVLCDVNLVNVVANLTIPNADLITATDIENGNVYFTNYDIMSKDGKSLEDLNSLYVCLLQDDNTTDNIIPIQFTIMLDDVQSAEGEYNITFGDLEKHVYIEDLRKTTTENSQYISISDFNLSFDLNLKDCDVSTKIDNINKTISTPEGDVIVESINYSPMSLCINFKEPLYTNLSERISGFNGGRGGYSFSTDENYITNDFDKVENYINMYFIYSNGERVFANRNAKTPIFENDTMGITNIIYDYYSYGLDMIDYTNIVSIEINGVVIPLK